MKTSEPIDFLPEDILESPVINTGPTRPYKIFFLEDNADDIELMQHELNEAKLSYTSAVTGKKTDFLNLILDFQPDVILADYSLSGFNGVQAFKIVRDEGLFIPFILVTGALSENLALECLKVGIDDFVLKTSFKRLPSSVVNAVEKKETEKEKNRIALELAKSHEELRLLVNHHHTSLEDERIIIARDLHDELGQVLTALKIDINMLSKKITGNKSLSPDFITTEFQLMSTRVDQITQSVRRISSGLRPETLDALGIVESIRSQTSEFEKRFKITCKTFLPGDPLNVSRDLSIAIYRIVQESLTNVARHAMASLVEIHVMQTGALLLLEIRDNGKGITKQDMKSTKSLGLIGLRERVNAFHGKLNISGSHQGTIITILLPLNSNNDDKSIAG